MRTREVPERVYEFLRGGFARHEAHDLLLKLRSQGGYLPGDVVHPGDPFGTVVAWLWETSPDEAISLIADFIAQLRHWDELTAQQRPSVRLNDLLDSLAMSLPHGFPSAEADALIARARAEVPAYFGSDPNS